MRNKAQQNVPPWNTLEIEVKTEKKKSTCMTRFLEMWALCLYTDLEGILTFKEGERKQPPIT